MLQTADLLIVLVGGNPLPNVVVADVLLPKDRRATVALVHSGTTGPVAVRIEEALRARRPTGAQALCFVPKSVDEGDPVSIFSAVTSVLADQASAGLAVNLDYTSGTKAMSVHAHRAVAEWAAKHPSRRTYTSYLNARKLTLSQQAAGSGEGAVSGLPVGGRVRVGLEELLRLHGWRLERPPLGACPLPALGPALAEAHRSPEAMAAWQIYKASVDKSVDRFVPWPEDPKLQVVSAAMRDDLRQDGSQLDLEGNTDHVGLPDGTGIKTLVTGTWLESWVFQQMQQAGPSDLLHTVVWSLKARAERAEVDTTFELDVVAMRGYQLFVCSCGTSEGKTTLKRKLFEVYLRAHQLGGDEAAVALVCPHSEPQKIEHELEFVLPSRGAVRVFGRNQLPTLGTELRRWIDDRGGVAPA